MSKWTLRQMPPQDGRMAIVTGANSGIGFETAAALASKGANVILACRNTDKGQAALEAMRARTPRGHIEVMPLDVSDLDSVSAFAEAYRARHKRLHLLINNAGVMAGPFLTHTKHGFETQFGTNHLGHFALTGQLLDPLKATAGSRVVVITSISHMKASGLNLEDPNYDQGGYTTFGSYARSKLANLTFMFELNRRLRAARLDIQTAAAHPGYTATNITLGANPEGNWLKTLAVWLGDRTFAMSPARGALCTLYAATATDIIGGEHIGPKGLFQFRGWPAEMPCSPIARDTEAGQRLWTVSEEMTGVRYL